MIYHGLSVISISKEETFLKKNLKRNVSPVLNVYTPFYIQYTIQKCAAHH